MGGYGTRSGHCGSTSRFSEEGCCSSAGAGISNYHTHACAHRGCGGAPDNGYVWQWGELVEELYQPSVCRLFGGGGAILHARISRSPLARLGVFRILYS